MSRLDELKKHYPELNITIIDILRKIDKTKSYKYMPLLCKLFGERFDVKLNYSKSSTELDIRMSEIKEGLKSRGINLEGMNYNEIYACYSFLDFYNGNLFQTVSEFMDFMERGRIENKDVTSYKSLEEMRGAVTLASIKEITQELEGQVIKEFEDEKWVVVRPLTFPASAKYGAGTRWCTTSQKEKNYFERYWRTGVLVYFINKKTGYKFAGYRDLDSRELSFWNAEDIRVDYLDINVDDYLFPTVSRIFKSTDTNKNLCSAELQEQVHQECIIEYKKMRAVEPGEEPTPVEAYEYINEDVRVDVPLQQLFRVHTDEEVDREIRIHETTQTMAPVYEQPNIA